MNTKNILTLVGLVVIVGSGALVYWQKNSTTPTYNTDTAVEEVEVNETNDERASEELRNDDETESVTTEEPTSGLTMETVATHNDSTSCWAVINGDVYDLTGWIPNHPGGPQHILNLCGTDGTAKFTGKHGGSSKVLSILAGFKIGTLSN